MPESPVESTSTARGTGGWLPQLLFAAIAGVAVFTFVEMAKHEEMRRACEPLVQLRPRYLGYDRSAPDFDISDGKGGRIKLSDYRGKVVVLHFWTRTCGPCLDELPEVGKFAKLLETRKDAVLLAVTIDAGPEAVADVYQTLFGPAGPPFRVGYDPDNTIVRDKYGTKLFPETWLIDPEGRIRARLDGIPYAGEGCGTVWKSPLLFSAIDALSGSTTCDLVVDAKVDPRPEKLIAACR